MHDIIDAVAEDWFTHGAPAGQRCNRPSDFAWASEVCRKLNRAGVCYRLDRRVYDRQWQVFVSEHDLRQLAY